MSKQKNTCNNVAKVEREIQDTVVFMTAYNIDKYKHHLPRFWRRRRTRDLLKQLHISGISTRNIYVSPNEKRNYTFEYDSLKQLTTVYFEEASAKVKEKSPEFFDGMMRALSFKHSARTLLDCAQVDIYTIYNMQSFLVMFDTKVLQVDPIALMMNDSLIVTFELINFESGIPLDHTAIYGRINNYGIHRVSKIKYFDESEFVDDDRKISDIIADNIFCFINKATKGKWEICEPSFVHTTFVLSNKINNIGEYFQKVLGAQIDNFEIHNIATSNDFEFYSKEFLGVATKITSNDVSNILHDCTVLESFKLYLLLKMIMDYEVNHKLEKIINNQIYVESLFYPAHVPIITLNVIDNLKNTVSFSRYKQAVDFKVQALKVRQERKRVKNERLLNILLYVLAFLGSAQTLQVLKTEFGVPFKTAFFTTIGIFIICGLIWVIRENK